jgi:hypothetical protein
LDPERRPWVPGQSKIQTHASGERKRKRNESEAAEKYEVLGGIYYPKVVQVMAQKQADQRSIEAERSKFAEKV